MTQPNATAELREAIYPYITGYVRLPDGRRLAPEEALDELEAIFQAREQQAEVNLRKDNDFIKALKRDVQQQLLTRLLGELPEKKAYIDFDDKATDDQDATYVGGFNEALSEVVSAIEAKLEELK